MALKKVDLVQVRRSGEHFKKVIREIFEHIPGSAQSIAGLARWTGVNKSTCQRLVQALTKSRDGLDVVITLPGPSGLKQLSKKFRTLINSQDCLDDFSQMAVEYENIIFRYASSQSELKRILLASQEAGSVTRDSYTRKLRKLAYETNREITGESVELYLAIHVSRVSKSDSSYLDELVVANRQGVELSPNARPFVQAFSGNQRSLTVAKPLLVNHGNLKQQVSSQSHAYLLEDFSTRNIVDCFSGSGPLQNNLIYNHSLLPEDKNKFDISIIFIDFKTQPNPLLNNHKTICQSLMQRSPAKRIFMLSLIENELDKASKIQAGCYPSGMKAQEVGHNPEELWSERFMDLPEVKLFPLEEEQMNSRTGISNLQPMLKQTFAMIDDDLDNYTAYSLDVDYPLWLATHRFYFDFS